MTVRVERRLAAILVADMVGYSRLMEADETGTIARQKAHRKELIDPKIAEHNGRIVKTTGDGLLIEFGSAVDAVECAVASQQALAEREANVPEDRRIQYRVGINVGDIVIDGDDIMGDGVNVAARLEALSEPGGIYVSGTVHEHVAGKIDLAFDDMGEQAVKNIKKPIQVYRVRLDGAMAAAIGATLSRTQALALPDKPSIAVLPFDNLSGDPEQNYLADAVAEDVTTALSKNRWLFVIARNSSFTYKGKLIDVKQVGRELGVRYVLEGSVRKSGNRIRVTGQLIEAATGGHIWAERFDREMEDIFALQDEITSAIVREVAPEIEVAEQERAARRAPTSLTAWEKYHRGMRYLYRATREDLEQARALFEAAIAADPNFGPARTGIAVVCYMNAWLGLANSLDEALSEAQSFAEEAIALDDRDAFAHYSLGRVLSIRGQFEAGVTQLRRALELNPNLAIAQHGLGLAHLCAGQVEQSLTYFDDAIRLSPRDPWLHAYQMFKGIALGYLGRSDEAVEMCRKACSRSAAGDINPNLLLAALLGNLGRLDEARVEVATVTAAEPNFTIARVETLPIINMVEPVKTWLLNGLRKAGLPG